MRLISEIKSYLLFRKISREMKGFNEVVEKQNFALWINTPTGRAFFDILLEQLNSILKTSFTGSIANYEDYMYQKGRVSMLNYILARLMEMITYEGEKINGGK